MEKLRSWLVRHRDQTSVSYNRFGRIGDEQDDKPPPTVVLVSPFNENGIEFMFFNYWHVTRAAASCACFGMAMVALFFILSLIEFDWDNHKRGTDFSALTGLILYLVVGISIHYYVLHGIKKQKPKYLIPFIIVYSFVLTSEIFWCLVIFFKAVEPNVGPEVVGSVHAPYLLLFFLVSCSVIIQSLMLSAVLRCRQFLSQKSDHDMEMKIAQKCQQENPTIRIIIVDGSHHAVTNGFNEMSTPEALNQVTTLNLNGNAQPKRVKGDCYPICYSPLFDMEQSNNLLFDEAAYKICPDPSKPIFFYEWLRYLERILPLIKASDLKNCQQKLFEQLNANISTGFGPPIRTLLAKCIALFYSVADTYSLFIILNTCNDVLKTREHDSVHLHAKLTALSVLGKIYEELGRLVGRTYEETSQILFRWIKTAESNTRAEILITFSSMVKGLGAAAHPIHRDLYKILSKFYLTDKIMNVRIAAIKCFENLLSDKRSPIYSTFGIESLVISLLKSMSTSSNHDVRYALAATFAKIALKLVSQPAITRPTSQLQQQSTTNKEPSQTINDLFNLMDLTFLKGAFGGFLKNATKKPLPECQKQIRLGLTLAYIEIAKGQNNNKWLEKNLYFWIKHMVNLSAKLGPEFYTNDPSHIHEALFMRNCIQYILQCTIGRHLSEPNQIMACRHFGALLTEYINKFDCAMDTEERILNADTFSSAHASLICLVQIGELVEQIGTPAESLFVDASGILEPIFASLLHPVRCARIAAAWCIDRILTAAVPSLATSLIDRCLNRLEYMKKSPEALDGCSLCLSAILMAFRTASIVVNVSFSKCQQIFGVAEQMLKTAAQNARMAHLKISAGWMLVAAFVSLGPLFVKHKLGQILTLWRLFFPRSVEEARNEKCRGDAFTWEGTLESRSGALASMICLLRFCHDLPDDDLIKIIITQMEITLGTLGITSELLLTHGVQLRPAISLLRVRLYVLLEHLNHRHIQDLCTPLLRELVADITLNDNMNSTIRTSLVPNICSALRTSMLTSWMATGTEHCQFEMASYFPNSFPRVLENDPISIIFSHTSPDFNESPSSNICSFGESNQTSLPVQVSSIDHAISLFGCIFPTLPTKHKLQIIQHFSECITNPNKSGAGGRLAGPRMVALQINVLCATCYAVRCIAENKAGKLEGNELRKAIIELALPFIGSENILLKCLAIELAGRTAQAVVEPLFVAANAQYCFDRLRALPDERSRAGHVLTLGCLHYYMGSLGIGQHLNTCVSMLLTLAQDSNSPYVQAWSTLALSLVASSGGGMFRYYVEPCVSLCMRLLLNTQNLHVEIIRSVAKLTSALITAIGPELSVPEGGIDDTRNSLFILCSMLINHRDVFTKAEGLYCAQQLYLFAHRFVQLDWLVLTVCTLLNSHHFVLRKAALSCLYQFLQREAKHIYEYVNSLIVPPVLLSQSSRIGGKRFSLDETGIEGLLFDMLDLETDSEMRKNIKESLTFFMQSTCFENLNFWLVLCKDVLASSAEAENVRSTVYIEESLQQANPGKTSTNLGDDENDTNLASSVDEDSLHSSSQSPFDKEINKREKIIPHRWTTQAFAFEIVDKIMTLCENQQAHFDLILAKQLQSDTSDDRQDFLVFHLSDLIKIGFMGATNNNKMLRLAGLDCLQKVIARFSRAEEPEYPGHLLLEQFQAQVTAALRPAFNPNTPCEVLAVACNVCSTWICSGVAHEDLNNLRRIYQLLQASLSRLKDRGTASDNQNQQVPFSNIIENSTGVIEKLSTLKAWAEVYISAVSQRNSSTKSDSNADENLNKGLLELVAPELNELIGYWISGLRDVALLSLPLLAVERHSVDYEAINFVRDSSEFYKEYYQKSWPPFLLASSIWLRQNDFNIDSIVISIPLTSESVYGAPLLMNGGRESIFNLLLGICVENLLNSKHHSMESDSDIQTCVNTLKNIFACKWVRLETLKEVSLIIELLNIIHRLLLTRDNLQTQRCCSELALSLVEAIQYALENEKEAKTPTLSKNSLNSENSNNLSDKPNNRLSFALLQLSLIVFIRQLPQINLTLKKLNPNVALHFSSFRFSDESNDLIHIGCQLLISIRRLWGHEEDYSIILPSSLFILLCVIKESSKLSTSSLYSTSVSSSQILSATRTAIMSLGEVCPNAPISSEKEFEKWKRIVQSTLVSLYEMAHDESVPRPVIFDSFTTFLSTIVDNKLDAGQSGGDEPFSKNEDQILSVFGFEILSRFCTLLKECLHSNNDQQDAQINAMQNINNLLRNPKLCSILLEELGPTLVAKLKPWIMGDSCNTSSGEIDLPVLDSLTDFDLVMIKETIKGFESVLAASVGEKQRIFMSLLVRSLARFLHPDPGKQLGSSPSNVRTLHEFSLQRLNVLGIHYPELLRTLLKASPRVRERIDAATQEFVKRQKRGFGHELQKKASVDGAVTSSVQPTIKLLTDFSAFSKEHR